MMHDAVNNEDDDSDTTPEVNKVRRTKAGNKRNPIDFYE